MTKPLVRPGTKIERALGLALAGIPPRQIAKSVDCPVGSVRVMLSHLRSRGVDIPRRAPFEVYLPEDVLGELDAEAARRGITRAEIMSLILSRTARDGLVTAVLDDEHEAA